MGSIQAFYVVAACAICLVACSSRIVFFPAHRVSETIVRSALGPSPSTVFGSNWTSYHNGLAQGVDQAGTDLSSVTRAWTSPTLDGKVYVEPLVDDGRVYVATENDTIYALAASSGQVLWRTHLGTPVPSSSLPCGNIGPTVGITGTPVIDPARGEIFAVIDRSSGAGAEHDLVGLDIWSGAVIVEQDVDPPGTDPLAQLQRTGLALDEGRVVFGMGGNYGDCSTYWGWVISVPEGGGSQLDYQVDAGTGEHEGAVWMGGDAPLVDASGNVWVAAGNGSNGQPTDPYDCSDSVIELSSSMGGTDPYNPQCHSEQYFAPSDWYSDNANDADLGGEGPALVGSSWVVQAGKSGTLYLLSQPSLGGIGGQVASISGFCSGDPAAAGGSLVSGNSVFIACGNGVHQVTVSSSGSSGSLVAGWQTASGADGPPILAGGVLWSIDKSSATLYGLDPATGAQVAGDSFSLGSEANSFPTPCVADGLIIAPSSEGLVAFDGPAGLPPAPPPPPPRPGYWEGASDGGSSPSAALLFSGRWGVSG